MYLLAFLGMSQLSHDPPGTSYSRWYHLDDGDVCYTNGERVYSRADGYDWVQLEDGGWVAAYLLGI